MVLYEEATSVVDELETEFYADRVESKVEADELLSTLVSNKAYELADDPDLEDHLYDHLLDMAYEILIDYKWYLELKEEA